MSQADIPNPSPNVSSESAPGNGSSKLVPLKRETIILSPDRGRLGLLVALCSLAGVVVGFGLSNMASSMRMSHCAAARIAPATPSVATAAPIKTPPWLGVRVTTSPEGGAYVQQVEPNSPAVSVGIRPGDVIVGFSSKSCPSRVKQVRSNSDLVRMVRQAKAGDRTRIVVQRQGEKRVMRVQLDNMPMQLFLEEIR